MKAKEGEDMEHLNDDKKRLDFLDSLTGQDHLGGFVCLRFSATGRGWRLHEHTKGYVNVRETIDAFMHKQANEI